MKRGSALLALLAFAAVGTLPGAAAQSAPPPELRVVVLSLDGLRPGEVDPVRMPNVAAFRDGATSYEASRSVMVAETIPNHVAMMTGVYPARSGIPANDFWDRKGEPESTELGSPTELEATTLFTTLDAACPDVSTAAVLSKRYLFDIFQAGGVNVAPDFSWRPEPLVADDFAPAVFAGPQISTAIADGADLLFVNLGDIDRGGNVDATGPTLGESAALRVSAKLEVDAIAGQLLDELQADPRWASTVVFMVSDHGFDWSTPGNFVNPQAVLEQVPATAGRFFTITAGGATPIYLLEPAAPDAEATLVAARQALLGVIGVDEVWYRQPNAADPAGDAPPELGLDHENAGDLIVVPSAGYRTSSPEDVSNPLAGNHGGLVTRQNTFMVGGGATFLAPPSSVAATAGDPGNRLALPEQSENVDVAPTVASLFGLPTRAYDGRVLTEAFAAGAPQSSCGAFASAPAGTPVEPTAPPSGTASTSGGLPATGGGRPPGLTELVVVLGAAAWTLRRRARTG